MSFVLFLLMLQLASLGQAPLRFQTLRRTHLAPKITAARLTINLIGKPATILRKARKTLVNLRHLQLRTYNMRHTFDQQAIDELMKWDTLRILRIAFWRHTPGILSTLEALQQHRHITDLQVCVDTGPNQTEVEHELIELVRQVPTHVSYLQLDIDVSRTIKEHTTSENFVSNIFKRMRTEMHERFRGSGMKFKSWCDRDEIAFYSK